MKGLENRRMVLALGMWAMALFVSLSLGTGFFGPAGAAVDAVLTGLLGIVGWAIPVMLVMGGLAIVERWSFTAFHVFVDTVLVVIATVLVHLASEGSGGVIGEWVGDVAQLSFGAVGAFAVGLGLALIGIAARFPLVSLTKRAVEAVEAWRTFVPDVPFDDSDKTIVEESSKFRNLAKRKTVVAAPSPEVWNDRADARTPIWGDQAGVWETGRTTEPMEPPFGSGTLSGIGEPVEAHRTTTERMTIERKKSVVHTFTLPSTMLLGRGDAAGAGATSKQLHEEGELLASTLGAYDVDAKVEAVTCGPTVTTFEASLAAGTKLAKVVGLADDLSLTFGRKVRVVPSRLGRVGFEVGNEERAAVGLRELVESEEFRSATSEMALPVVLGKDVRGEGVYADLAEMPHVLAAGATGAGKSVGLNVMLASLLYSRTPEELRFIMIDPKVVELQPYARIPHMLLPVVTDMSKAVAALHWAVGEMERRYQLLASAGAKNISSYNGRSAASDKLPYIVIVVDEFADLIASQGKAVEGLVSRLAQKARAAGMHMVLATQRPSVDVITGTIKANFPTRIAFRVAQRVDSRVVLDEQGAEQLTGRGDMLVKMNGADALVRVQCPMITEGEIEALTGYLCTQGMPIYDESILALDPAGESKDKKSGRKGAGSKVLS
jgi:hypothetical protein